MKNTNEKIAEIFNKIADLLEILHQNPFRIRAYRTASRTIYGLSQNVQELYERGDKLSDLPGIGKDLEQKIIEIIETGHLTYLENLESQLPSELVRIMKIPGLGGRRVSTLFTKLGVNNLDSLERAANHHDISKLPGFGEKIEKSILESIASIRDYGKQISIYEAEKIVKDVISFFSNQNIFTRLVPAGSFRRGKDIVRDIDILATCKSEGLFDIKHIVKFPDIEKIIAKGETKTSFILKSGIQVDLRIVSDESFGSSLHYFTGSKNHNIAIRKRAIKKGLKINEYGIYSGDKRIGGEEEYQVYESVDLPFIDPELREDNGEIAAAESGFLPNLLQLQEIQGDLHAHTTASDGHASLDEMVRKAVSKGYLYLAITDHSKSLALAHGLSVKEIRNQYEKIDKLNSNYQNFRILKGCEVDIMEDGSLDMPDEVLREMDVVVCSIHTHFNLPRDTQTNRILKAISNRYFQILAHPTGRIINRRQGYQIDMEQILIALKEHHAFIELNSYPDRLDINELHFKQAKELGVKVVISTDSHKAADLDFMALGVRQARRGWAEKADVLNTLELNPLLKHLKKRF